MPNSSKTPPKKDIDLYNQEFFSVPEAAILLGKSENSIRRYCESGKLLSKKEKFGTKDSFKIPRDALAFFRHNEEKKKSLRQPQKPKFLGKGNEVEYLDAFEQACISGEMSKKGLVFSEKTAEYYKYHMSRFYKAHNELTLLNLKMFINSFEKTQYATRQKVHKAALCFARYLYKIKMADSSLVEEIRAMKVPGKGKDKLAEGRRLKTIKEDQLIAIFKACGNNIQDLLLITLLSNTGVRASEYTDILVSDIDLEKRILIIRKGKGFGGGKTRRIPLTNQLISVITQYLGKMEKKPADYLHVNRKGQKMDKNGVYQRVRRLGEIAGVENAAPHALRRAFVTIYANKGKPLHILQTMCGHEDIQTTMLYLNASEEEMINEVASW